MSVRTSDTGNTALKETLHRHKLVAGEHKHPVNVVHHEEATFGEHLADKISSGIGSWPFLIIQTAAVATWMVGNAILRSEEHTSELQSRFDLVCRLLLEKKNNFHYLI